jgi:ribosomal RNA methyltransferase Nop2
MVARRQEKKGKHSQKKTGTTTRHAAKEQQKSKTSSNSSSKLKKKGQEAALLSSNERNVEANIVKQKEKIEEVDVEIPMKGNSDNKKKTSPQKKIKPAPAPPVEETSEEEELEDDNDDDGNEDDDDDDENEDEDEGEEEKTNLQKGKFFSDNNAAWLKPKKEKSQLLSSDDDDEIGDNDEIMGDDDDSEEELEVERQSRRLDAEMEAEEEEAEEELRDTVAKHTSIYHLPTKEELERNVDRVVPPSEIRSHVESILEVLADFSKRREPGRARSEYIEQLASFMAELYGYLPELMEYFLTMFSPTEALEFVEYSDKPRPMVIRTNTLKTRRKDLAMALMKRGVSLDPLAAWSKVGLKISESPVPVGATPEYLSGHYMLQSAASMCPVLALAPEPKERVLDMSAAPGGKTSYLAQLMRNTGVIFANDLKADRQKATVANMHRLGVKNVVACMHDGRKLPQLFRHFKFDRVLLDAPCSGLGVISRDPSVKVQRTLADVNKCAHLQKELLLAAIDVLNHKSKTGGIMVYSTCSVSVAENEEVVNYALQKRDIKIIETGLDFGKLLLYCWDSGICHWLFLSFKRPTRFCYFSFQAKQGSHGTNRNDSIHQWP